VRAKSFIDDRMMPFTSQYHSWLRAWTSHFLGQTITLVPGIGELPLTSSTLLCMSLTM